MSKSLKLFGGAFIGTAAVLVAAANFADRMIAPLPEQASRMTVDAPADMDGMFIAAAQADEVPADARLGLGREALAEEIAVWDIDVRPDGTGLPEGSGDVMTGEEIFVESCAVCHGDFGEGVGRWPVLTGGFNSLTKDRPVKTTGSYWPYLSTVYDYINRAMPFGNAQSLQPDDVYAITAYLLYMNDLVDEDFTLSRENFAGVEMPNADGFYMDDRAETEIPVFTGEPCMEACKDTVEITMRAAVLDVTPDETAAEAAADAADDDELAPESEAAPDAAPASEGDGHAAIDPALVDAGEKVFRKCKACHQIGDGAKNRTGPHLNGVVGRKIAAVDGFKYSKTLDAMDGVWDEEALSAFLANPKAYAKGTKMSFAGLRKPEDLAAIIAYMKAAGQ
ncbi:c-type cytochrome [Primorskyibacter marinus]|uniref:c-type cytochrome n=1 Tax=Primorskyibacter marinus TaxID=1977320 RepID=UPI000E30A575|nr:c-type cytochrome [Primorskyibacter marinus]